MASPSPWWKYIVDKVPDFASKGLSRVKAIMLRSQMDATYPSEADLQKLIISLSIQQQRSYTEMFCRLAEIDLIRLNLPKFA